MKLPRKNESSVNLLSEKTKGMKRANFHSKRVERARTLQDIPVVESNSRCESNSKNEL